MVHGYHAKWLAVYNRASNPTFSVGEYDWGQHAAQRGWVWNTATTPGQLRTASSVFDFSTLFTLRDNKGSYHAWYGLGRGIGLIGDNTDDIAWKNRAVTFLVDQIRQLEPCFPRSARGSRHSSRIQPRTLLYDFHH